MSEQQKKILQTAATIVSMVVAIVMTTLTLSSSAYTKTQSEKTASLEVR